MQMQMPYGINLTQDKWNEELGMGDRGLGIIGDWGLGIFDRGAQLSTCKLLGRAESVLLRILPYSQVTIIIIIIIIMITMHEYSYS